MWFTHSRHHAIPTLILLTIIDTRKLNSQVTMWKANINGLINNNHRHYYSTGHVKKNTLKNRVFFLFYLISKSLFGSAISYD